MNTPWAICIARDDVSSLVALRLCSGIEIGESGRCLWLRGQRCDEILAPKLAALPALERYDWSTPLQIRVIGRRIPDGDLPNLSWQPLEEWLRVEIPVLAMPANLPAPACLHLVRSTDERDSELLLTRIEELIQYAALAAQVRLAPLQFAADEAGQIFVRGQPLPPLPGQRFVLCGKVAIPAGHSWEPTVDASVLERCFGVSGDALVVWNEQGTITRLHAEQFMPVSRSALRATQSALTGLR